MISIEVLYEDNHLLIVNKPAGILTNPSGTTYPNQLDIAKEWIKEKYQKPGAVYLENVHRIDRPVSGIVVFAKTSKALSRLNASIKENKWIKIYHAIVEGSFVKTEDMLEHYLFHDEHKSRKSFKDEPGSKLCRLKYFQLEKHKNTSYLKIELITGRYHQIRSQLSIVGHPIVGDLKYGSKLLFLPQAIALHHAELTFPHPTKDEMVKITVSDPDYFTKKI